ncbi:hypothetical protein [Asticcacaulis sp. YBE204]|uniref:hypothetical protein n=1 Tax=Asticcacaulis sp. YBE204 TaxID=1282363 RepID=UPI0003C3E4A8|nr:hypothetical protein [Asticcacaulis sp. YBE204]ESQ80045.1 hypothetical protein AEYBE204_05350 [Asticcacaulis sp. YBE204]
MTDTYAPLHDRLMIQAQRMLAEIERAKPSTLKEIVAVLSALCVATRLIRQLHTPLTKAKVTDKVPSAPVSPETDDRAPSSLRSGEVSTKPTEGAAPPQTPPALDVPAWQKGWSDKQAKLREQRAARTGKWPDGTPYRKTG